MDSALRPTPPLHSTGGKTEDFMAAAKLLHKAGGEVKVPTYLVPATQKVRSREAGGDWVAESQARVCRDHALGRQTS